MSISQRFRMPILASAAVVITALGVVVPGSAASPARSQAHTSAAAGTNGYTSRVVGTFGRAGTVRGQFVPVRSFVRRGTTYVQGNLTATLRRGSGALVGRTHRHDLALPVHDRAAHLARPAAATAATAASCTILHLVLGPLDLNLLGLKVHLDRVVLDITAESGPGNLLGNLLCAVAHLLDMTNPGLLNLLQLSNFLNRLIARLT
jgi:hypothetical protein